ncbi:MAG: hypothetical protein K8F91_07390, partial [Candidatus Obscuribacterales bacterium]|nr:hypothetical protein [Candidatus Obscuribacterales bacterium]
MNNQSLLGQLLLDLGWIGATDLENVVALSCQSGESIGRLLVEQGRITSRELQNLIEVQARVRDGRIHNAVGRHALDLSSWCGASLDQVLLWIGPGQADVDIDYSNRLGELLIGADCVERAIVEQSLCLSMQTGLQLGKILTIQKRVPENMVGLTLEAQKLIRAELLSREQALAG